MTYTNNDSNNNLNNDDNSGNISIRFWRQYVSLFASIAAIVVLLLTSDRKSSRCKNNAERGILTQVLLKQKYANQQEPTYSFLETLRVIVRLSIRYCFPIIDFR